VAALPLPPVGVLVDCDQDVVEVEKLVEDPLDQVPQDELEPISVGTTVTVV
jgi:hypothetical protein